MPPLRLACLFTICLLAFHYPTRAQKRLDSDTTLRRGIIQQIDINGKRSRYKKQGNPGYELARRLVDARERNDPRNHNDISYTHHEKITIALDDFALRDSSDAMFELNKSIDVNQFTHRLILPVAIKERILATKIINRNKSEEELINNSMGFDKNLNEESFATYLRLSMESFDLFADHISFMQRRFVNPISRAGLDFYRFRLAADTITEDGSRYVQLDFFPANKESISISGSLMVSADEQLFIKNASLYIPRSANLNFVRDFQIVIHYSPLAEGGQVIEREDMNFNFSITENSTALNFQRTSTYTGYNFFKSGDTLPTNEAKSSLTDQDIERMNNFTRTMRKNTLYRISEFVLEIASQASISTGRYFDLGPIMNFVSGNNLEGTRFTVGGMTTPNLMKRLFAEAYVGYGTRDRRWKYSGALEWSFNERKKHVREFPVHSLRLSYTSDIRHFGASFSDMGSDNLFSWLKRASDNSLTYINLAELTYNREHLSHIGYSLTARHYTESASAVMSFAPSISSYTMSEIEARVRYAPGERLFQTKRRRYSMTNYKPIIEISHTSAAKNLLGSDFTSNITQATITNRFNLQPFGYLDLMAKGTAQWNAVPYMLLCHPRVNLTYFARQGSFSLMHPLELLYDKSITWDLEYHMDGLILNRIPLIKRLKWREVFSFKGVWGNLSKKNNPLVNPSLIGFPGTSTAIGHEPYMEIGIGIENIFNLLRVDYVWRLTYRDKPSAIKGGVMFGVKFKF